MQRPQPGIAKASPILLGPGADLPDRATVRRVLGDLEALIARREAQAVAAFSWGNKARGGARLIRSPRGLDHESLRISWNQSEIECIEIESRIDPSFSAPASETSWPELAAWLVPKVWAYMRRGCPLPNGIERFAELF